MYAAHFLFCSAQSEMSALQLREAAAVAESARIRETSDAHSSQIVAAAEKVSAEISSREETIQTLQDRVRSAEEGLAVRDVQVRSSLGSGLSSCGSSVLFLFRWKRCSTSCRHPERAWRHCAHLLKTGNRCALRDIWCCRFA